MVIVLFTAMVVVTMAIVLCRYVFKVQFVPGEEIARYLMIWCGYAGAAMGFRTHAHVGVVVFAEKFPNPAAGYYQNQTHNQYRNCSNPVSCKLQLPDAVYG